MKKKKGITINGKDTGDFTVPEDGSTARLHGGEGNQELETHLLHQQLFSHRPQAAWPPHFSLLVYFMFLSLRVVFYYCAWLNKSSTS